MSYAKALASSTPVKGEDSSKKRELSESSMNESLIHIEKKNKPDYSSESVHLAESDFIRISNMIKDMVSSQVEPLLKSIVTEVTKSLHDRITTLETDRDDLRSQVKSLSAQVDKLELSSDAAEQYSRRNCLRVVGVSETESEKTDDIIMELASEIEADISLADIDRSHRLKKPSEWTTPKAIIVKFASYRARDKFFKNRSALKGNRKFHKVFINEDLTSSRSKIFRKCRKLFKDNCINSCWTHDGRIYIRDTHDKKSLISRLSDLDEFTS